MATIVLRSVKGSPLSIEEADGNFSNLNTEIGQKLDITDFTAEEILLRLDTYDANGDGQGLNAATLLEYEPQVQAVADSIVLRDDGGSIFGDTFVGNMYYGGVDATGFGITGDVTGNVSGTASDITGVLSVANGGTGATSISGARQALGLGDIVDLDSSNVNFTGGTITGITDLAIADGGTGASTAATARVNLGLVVGQDVQAHSNVLAAFSGVTTNGIVAKTAAGAATSRTIVANGNGLTIEDGDGVDGNPTLTLSTTADVVFNSLTVDHIDLDYISKTGTDGSGDIGQSDNEFANVYATNFNGTATAAKYADLAEKYLPDADYPVGTVMTIGGDAEITASKVFSRAIGVISENPAFKMNSELEGGVYVALKGRVPVRVVGPVNKGDDLVPTEDGNAFASEGGKVFAVALESKTGAEVKLVEAVIL